jgi:uncharacterized protein YjdB
MNPYDSMYKILIKANGVQGKVNNVDCKFLITECQDSNINGLDVLTISTDQPLEQGYFVNIDTDIYLVIDKKTETKHYQSYNVGSIEKINHINKFVSDDTIYQCPSICTNITKGKLGLIYESAGITEATGVWCFITKYDDISKKIGIGKRFIINGNAWKVTSLDYTTDEGILYVILRLDNINTETDDLINEVANGLSIPNYAITLSSTTQSLYRGKTYQITANCTKNNVTDTAPVLTYISSNPSLATVNSSGLVTAQSTTGSCKITVNYHNSSVDLTLNVIEDVYNITLAESSASKYNDETYQLNSTCKKDNEIVSNPVITYSSDNTAIANVDSNGMVTMVSVGTCNIIATYNGVSASLSLEVKAHSYSIVLSENSTSIIQDGTYQISATCKKDNIEVSNPNIVYSSSDSTIATVSVNGEVTAISVGNCTITSTYQGVNSVLNITVQAKPIVHTYTIDLSGNNNSLYLGDTLQLTAICKDNDVTVGSPTITWSSSDTNIVSIDSNGLLTSVALGSATITATFNGVSTTLSLNVIEKPHTYTISLAETSKTLNVGDSYNIIATCTDNGNTVSSPVIAYSSNNSSVATVDSTGKVTTISSGNCVITATYNGVSSSITLTINAKVVPTYTYAFSQSITALKIYMTTVLTTTKTVGGVADSTLYIDYSFDTNAQTLINQGKIVVTRKSDSSISIKNASVSTVTNIYLTVTDHSNGTKILDAQKITLTGM